MIKEYIGNFLKSVFNRLAISLYNKHFRKNIDVELDRQSLVQTARYVSRKMADAHAFPHKFALYQALLGHQGDKEVLIDSPNEPGETYGASQFATVPDVGGLWLEFGVYRGETINRLAGLTSSRVYGFDSFEGLPEFWRDGFYRGHFALERLPQVKSNVTLIKGWFSDVLPDFLNKHHDTIAVLHIDCDLYSSAKCVLDLCADRIVKGTIIIFDEYFNYPGWREGEYKAFREWCSERQRTYTYAGYVRDHEQVAVCML